jgi:RHS repeat-associated protein
VSESTALPLNQWVHVAATYDGQKIRVYRSGTKVAESAALNRNLPVGTSGWRIGAGHDAINATTVWNGKLDDVALYNRVLSDAEVARHANPLTDGGDACDGCQGNPDPTCAPTTCVDHDGDGYGIAGASNCSAGQPLKVDCDDGDARVNPGATEVMADGRDNDCDGVVDEVMAKATEYRWDGNGNLVSDGREWDARDRLVSGGYGYDTSNLRTAMGGQKVLLDGIEEVREYGGNEARYEHDPSSVDGLLAQTTSAGKGYFVTDALGSVYGVVDSTGMEVSKYGYDVYGVRTATTEALVTPWGFTGRRVDSGTEMYYRARYLNPGIGGFLSNDPLKEAEANSNGPQASPWLSTLSRAGNGFGVESGPYIYPTTPTVLVDPTGLFVLYTGFSASASFGNVSGGVGFGAAFGISDGFSSALALTASIGISFGVAPSIYPLSFFPLGHLRPGLPTVIGGAFNATNRAGVAATVDLGFYPGLTDACSYSGPFVALGASFGVFGMAAVFSIDIDKLVPPLSWTGLWAAIGWPVGFQVSGGIRYNAKMAFSVDAVVSVSQMFWSENCKCPKLWW